MKTPKHKFSLTNIIKKEESPFLIRDVIQKLECDYFNIKRNNKFGNVIRKLFYNKDNLSRKGLLINGKEIFKSSTNREDIKKLEEELKLDKLSTSTICKNLENSVNIGVSDDFLKLPNIEKQQIYELRASTAFKNKEIFKLNGYYPVIRTQLKNRGWIEMLNKNYLPKIQSIDMYNLLKYANINNDHECALLSKMASKYRVNFIFGGKCDNKIKGHYPFYNSIKYINPHYDFTNKKGLSEILNKSLKTINSFDIQTPVIHTLPYDHIDFIRNYRSMCCLSLLTFMKNKKDLSELFAKNGKISVSVLTVAILRIYGEICIRKRTKVQSTINQLFRDSNNLSFKRWELLYDSINCIVNLNCQFVCVTSRKYRQIYKNNRLDELGNLLEEAEKVWPLLPSYGQHNLWIVKPCNACQGKGIVIKKKYIDIITYARDKNEGEFIVQKYIEKPYLIYNTKFDIRQHILISITDTKLNVWMYKDCYLRFASYEYQQQNLNRSIHITNYAVQKDYKNSKRNINLPPHNMWSRDEFKEYLDEHKLSNIWNDLIYPGMKTVIIKIISKVLSNISYIPNTYELYGCDFLLNENLTPILLEINRNPDMKSSTIVTQKLCPQIYTDIIKVIIDIPYYSKLSTGEFELIYDYVYKKI